MDGFGLDNHKTKTFVAIAENFGWDNKTLIVETAPEKNLILSSRNVPGVKVASRAQPSISTTCSITTRSSSPGTRSARSRSGSDEWRL